MRFSRRRAAGVESGTGARSARAGQPDHRSRRHYAAHEFGIGYGDRPVPAGTPVNRARNIAIGVLAAVFGVSLLANFFAPAPYAMQFRDFVSAPASDRFWLGTDELGRDR